VIGQAMMAGAGFGLGVALVWYGLRPPRPALAVVLERLGRRAEAPPTGRQRRYRLLGAPLSRLGLPSARMRQDLALVEKDVDTFLAEQAVIAGIGALAAPLLATLWGAGGLVPLWLSLAGGLLGYRWAAGRVQQAARLRRDELVHVTSVVQDLVTTSLAGGAGIDEALDDATGVCTGWAAQRLRRTLRTARRAREPVWQALARLGETTGTGELVEFANAVNLATGQGTRVRDALAAHAATARTRATAAMETAARSAGVRMSFPVLLLALGYGLWLLYPALALMRTGLTN
jgi:Flp pilus assembly protein TadB